MAFTDVWEETNPAGTEAASLGDNRIRNLKIDLGERLEEMLYGFNIADGTGDESTFGVKKLIFKVQAGDPTVGASTIGLFAKDSEDSKAELFWKDEDADVRQFTEGGQLLLGKSTTPYPIMHNTTEEDGDGGRESRLTAKGEQSGGEVTTLGYLEFAHKGTSDDEQGRFQIVLNDGDDGDSPSAKVLTCYADDAANAGEAFIDVSNSEIVLDENNMASDSDKKLATQQSIKAYIDTQLALSAMTPQDSDNQVMVEAHAYLAQTDGFVSVPNTDMDSGHVMTAYVETAAQYAIDSDPTAGGVIVASAQATATNQDHFLSFSVASGEYFEIVSTSVPVDDIFWRSRGPLSKPVDQD